MSLWSTNFKVSPPPSPDDVAGALWIEAAEAWYENRGTYQAAIMDQYKLYVELTDRISARRGLANTFFLTLNAAIFTLLGIFWKDRPQGLSSWFLLPILLLVLGLCWAWFLLVRSYRQLNSAKFAVIGAFERRLPASPWWNGEWSALKNETANKSTYRALTHLEIWVPLLFGLAYVFGAIVAILTGL